jgi:hypothetical protein
MCVEGGLCVILSFERFKIFPTHNYASVCVIHASACVDYASSMCDYAWDTRRPSVLMRRNWSETAQEHVRPLTPHVHITHEPRTYYVHSTDNHGTFAKRACLDALRQWFMRRMFVEYCIVFARMRPRARYVSDSSVIVSDMCAVHAWFVSDFYPRHLEKLVNLSTHKTQSVRDLWASRVWSAVWLALKIQHIEIGEAISQM